jgi:hypothetical protein
LKRYLRTRKHLFTERAHKISGDLPAVINEDPGLAIFVGRFSGTVMGDYEDAEQPGCARDHVRATGRGDELSLQ